MNHGTEGLRVFACLGEDIEQGAHRVLETAIRYGYRLLALDSVAIGAATERGLPYDLLDDWLDHDARQELLDRTYECTYGWFLPVKDTFTVDGICWPEFDARLMLHFWYEYNLQVVLGEAFRRRGVARLGFVRSFGTRPSLAFGVADTFGAYWHTQLGRYLDLDVIPVSVGGEVRRDLFERGLKKIKRMVEAAALGHFPTRSKALTDRVTFAITDEESGRFSPLVLELASDTPVGAVLLEPDLALAIKRGSAWHLPVIPGPPIRSAPIAEVFLRGLKRAHESSAGRPWEHALTACGFHFDFYAKTRWPQMVNGLRSWGTLWETTRPRAVVVSTLEDPRSQLPAEAARSLGIPSIAIPHAALDYFRPTISSDWQLHADPLQRAAFEAMGLGPRKLRGCKGIVSAYEYPASDADLDIPQGWRVLALTNPVSFAGLRRGVQDFVVSHKDQISALRALADPPTHLSENIHLLIKPHPGFPDLELHLAADDRLRDRILSPDTDLLSALDQCDIVVCTNYLGSALFHVLRKEKPVIFFWTSPLLGSWNPDPYSRLLPPAGVTVTTPEELWESIEKYFTDTSFRDVVRKRSVNFAQTYLDDSDYPTLFELLNELEILV